MDFIALDVETANADLASICQIGFAYYRNGVLMQEWSSLIDPEDYFDLINVGVHGINEADTRGKPTFSEIAPLLTRLLKNTVTVSHTHFDRASISQALSKYGLPSIETTWLDSACVARRTWEECSYRGYGLSNVCRIINYEFNHHDALEDAKASANILLAASKKTGLSLDAWLKRVKQPINPSCLEPASAIKRDGNPEGSLYGEILAFTGTLEIPRREAADLAAQAGCTVEPRVTKKTSVLVVGDMDISKLAGHAKSRKHRKAEQLISAGQTIRILKESDFKALLTSKT